MKKRFAKIYLEISNVCNRSCAFCPGTTRAARFLSVSEFALLCGKLRPYTDYLYFHLMGEPLLHPALADFLRIAGELGFRVILTTNGTLLPQCADSLLAAPALHKVNISLQSFEANDGGTLETYIADCAEFARRCSTVGKLCVLRLWNKNGLDGRNGDIISILERSFPPPWRESRGSFALGDRLWLEPGEKFDWPDLSLDSGGSAVFCYGLRDQLGVLCDGTVVPCCLDHNGDISLGNLFTEELDSIMSTDRFQAIYDGFSRRVAVEPLCRRCGYAKRFG